jgi:hypothetical protein
MSDDHEFYSDAQVDFDGFPKYISPQKYQNSTVENCQLMLHDFKLQGCLVAHKRSYPTRLTAL